MSRRSLTIDYLAELAKSTKLEQKDILLSYHRGQIFKNPEGSFKEFLIKHDLQRKTEDHIRTGMKMLALEEQCGIRSLSAILTFSYSWLRECSKESLHDLAEVLRSKYRAKWGTEAYLRWFDDCWAEYHAQGTTSPKGSCDQIQPNCPTLMEAADQICSTGKVDNVALY